MLAEDAALEPNQTPILVSSGDMTERVQYSVSWISLKIKRRLSYSTAQQTSLPFQRH
jgi:hypothetical protein